MTRTLPLAELLPDVDGVPRDLLVTGLVQDSREVRPGNAFVAIAGFGTHGMAFAERALADAAVPVIAVPGLRARRRRAGRPAARAAATPAAW